MLKNILAAAVHEGCCWGYPSESQHDWSKAEMQVIWTKNEYSGWSVIWYHSNTDRAV